MMVIVITTIGVLLIVVPLASVFLEGRFHDWAHRRYVNRK